MTAAPEPFKEVRTPLYVALVLYLFLELAYYFVGDFSPEPYYKYVWGSAFGLFTAGIWAKNAGWIPLSLCTGSSCSPGGGSCPGLPVNEHMTGINLNHCCLMDKR